MSILFELWENLSPFHEIITAICISLVTTFLLWFFRAKVKIIWGSTSQNYHTFKIIPDGEKISIWTEKFYVQNVGKKPASNIEIVFSEPLSSYNLWPPREHTKSEMEDGSFILRIPSLAPSELLIVDMIDIDLRGPKLLSVNLPDTISRKVDFAAQRQFGKSVTWVVGYLMLAGFVGTVYVTLLLLS